MTMAKSGRDRRRWRRAPLRGKLVGQIYTEHAAPIVDLSEGGALLEVPCALRPGSVYSVRLSLGPDTVLTLKASVVRSHVHRVVSVGEGETRIRYRVALQFVELRAPDQELLRRRLASEATPEAAGLKETPAVAGEVGLHLESRVLMLSPGGMTVRMPFRLEIDSTVTCTLDIDGVPSQLRGIVRDAHQADPSGFVVGVEFIDLRDEARASIEAYVARMA
jgi:PilZ domain-containing protein